MYFISSTISRILKICREGYENFELVYWNIWAPDKSYGLLERVILEVHEARTDKLLFLDIIE